MSTPSFNQTAKFYILKTALPDGSQLPVAVAVNSWLGPELGWRSGEGVVFKSPEGSLKPLDPNSVYKIVPDLAKFELLNNVMTCPAEIDAKQTCKQIVDAWEENRATAQEWRTEGDGSIVLGHVQIQSRDGTYPTDRPKLWDGLMTETQSNPWTQDEVEDRKKIIYGQTQVDSLVLRASTIQDDDTAHSALISGSLRHANGDSQAIRVRVKPVPGHSRRPSLVWERDHVTKDHGRKSWGLIAGKLRLRNAIDKAPREDGDVFVKGTYEEEQVSWTRVHPLNWGNPIFYNTVTEAETTYGLFRSRHNAVDTLRRSLSKAVTDEGIEVTAKDPSGATFKAVLSTTLEGLAGQGHARYQDTTLLKCLPRSRIDEYSVYSAVFGRD